MNAGELRAFDVMTSIAPGHAMVLVTSDHSEPHFHAGEFAVIDTTDREIRWGNAYAVNQRGGPAIWAIHDEPPERRARRQHPERACAWLHPLLRHAPSEIDRLLDLGRMPRYGLRMSDGPIHLDYLQGLILGHVVGIFQHADAPRPLSVQHLLRV
jgi:hypothetical protein